MLRARAAAADLPLEVASAGLLFDGRAAERNAITAAAKLGVDLSEHRSQTITVDLLRQAKLVLTMEFRQLREVVLTEGGELERTFTLPDLVARAEAAPRRPGEAFEAWVARLAAGRSNDDVVRGDRDLQVADPMGQSKRVFRRCAAEIDAYLARFVAAGFPGENAGSGPAAAPPDEDHPTSPLRSS